MTAARKKAKRPRLSADARAASVTLIEGVFLDLMKGMLKAQDVEERYVVLHSRIRVATEHQVATLARSAAEYYVSHLTESMPIEEVDRLKKASFDHALGGS